MLICERDGKFHIVRKITKSGMSLKVNTYCGQDGFSEIDQLPIEFLGKLCAGCQGSWDETKKAAG
ncbi:hypothetical protein LCGC14_1493020 [marine sediment metagenome]|uniref:Uncharacterized protein n=1 Tax=marine sediment metagenome TaxID=412755 RepID=A0A0F9J6A2_9ZZZZ